MSKTGKLQEIAIIGMGFRFPGAHHPSTLWQRLVQGKSSISPIPETRWRNQDYYSDELGTPGKTCSQHAALLEDLSRLDYAFFGLSKRDQRGRDPQQIMLLEASYDAFEHAGYSLSQISGSKTAVYIGIGAADHQYTEMLKQSSDNLDFLDINIILGNDFATLSSRLSYQYNFIGLNLPINLACASGLVGLDLAQNALSSGECNMALVAGVNYVGSPVMSICLSQGWAMSERGEIRSFDASTDGYVRAEGAGALLLKRRSDAERDGDAILGILKGVGVCHKGHSGGSAIAPNEHAMQTAIERCLNKTRCSPEAVDYIEAHGEAIIAADINELRALNAVFSNPERDRPCLIGSVKPNLGHMEWASGVASVIKLLLAFQHQALPAHLHFKSFPKDANIADSSLLQVVDKLTPWPKKMDRSRIAGVNTFNIGGVCAFALIEEPPSMKISDTSPLFGIEKHLFCLSAKSETGLLTLVERYIDWLHLNPKLPIASLCYAASCEREHYPVRRAWLVDSVETLITALEKTLKEDRAPQTLSPGKRLFLFTGQGCHADKMGAYLYSHHPVFAAAIDTCAAIVTKKSSGAFPGNLHAWLVSGKHSLEQEGDVLTQQVSLFAYEYALAKLWMSWNIQPDGVLGHSLGEYVAAHLAGILSLEDALYLVIRRSQLVAAMPPQGRMLAVIGDRSTILKHNQRLNLAIANDNHPGQIVFSGHNAAIENATQAYEEYGLKTIQIKVDYPYHCDLMADVAAGLLAERANVKFNASGTLPIFSNVTGHLAQQETLNNIEYWANHICKPVQFSQCLTAAYTAGFRQFIEIGPKPVLSAIGQYAIEEFDCDWLPSVKKTAQCGQQLLTVLKQLYESGVHLDWPAVYADRPRKKTIDLPMTLPQS